jgi:hypothetical protein
MPWFLDGNAGIAAKGVSSKYTAIIGRHSAAVSYHSWYLDTQFGLWNASLVSFRICIIPDGMMLRFPMSLRLFWQRH